MQHHIRFEIEHQPDTTTCGPTCLHALYRHFGDKIPLRRVVREAPKLRTGGTLAVMLGCHALRRGYDVTLYTYDLQVFDPTWFDTGVDLSAKLDAQLRAKPRRPKLARATRSYQEFLRLGGRVLFEELTDDLVSRHVRLGVPVLTGLNSTYLYRVMRERGRSPVDDDVRGEPQGHFVVITGYDSRTREAQIADPFERDGGNVARRYAVGVDRLMNSILLGVMTYDANLLVVQPHPSGGEPTDRSD